MRADAGAVHTGLNPRRQTHHLLLFTLLQISQQTRMPELVFTALVRLASTRIVLLAQHQKFPLKIRGCTTGKIVATLNGAATHRKSRLTGGARTRQLHHRGACLSI